MPALKEFDNSSLMILINDYIFDEIEIDESTQNNILEYIQENNVNAQSTFNIGSKQFALNMISRGYNKNIYDGVCEVISYLINYKLSNITSITMDESVQNIHDIIQGNPLRESMKKYKKKAMASVVKMVEIYNKDHDDQKNVNRTLNQYSSLFNIVCNLSLSKQLSIRW